MVLATFVSEMLSNHTFYNMFENVVAKTFGFTTFPTIVLLKPSILETLMLEISTVELFSNCFSSCKTQRSSNLFFETVIKPIAEAEFQN